jgi:DNA-binding NarL/FixJ family response regulator
MIIKIVLADGSDLMMVGTQAIIEAEAEYRAFGKAHTLNHVLLSIQLQIPEIVIFSECLYDTDILSAVDAVRHAAPKTFMIVVGMMTDGTLIHNLYVHSIKGYLYRGDPLQECLLPAIRTALQDRPYLSSIANAEYPITLTRFEHDLVRKHEASPCLYFLLRKFEMTHLKNQYLKLARPSPCGYSSVI